MITKGLKVYPSIFNKFHQSISLLNLYHSLPMKKMTLYKDKDKIVFFLFEMTKFIIDNKYYTFWYKVSKIGIKLGTIALILKSNLGKNTQSISIKESLIKVFIT